MIALHPAAYLKAAAALANDNGDDDGCGGGGDAADAADEGEAKCNAMGLDNESHMCSESGGDADSDATESSCVESAEREFERGGSAEGARLR
jgi:hypothetical protein